MHESLKVKDYLVKVDAAPVGLYTILPSSILYGVCHTKGGSVAGRILRNERAVVLQ